MYEREFVILRWLEGRITYDLLVVFFIIVFYCSEFGCKGTAKNLSREEICVM